VRRIALAAASLAALSGCGGEATTTKKQEKAPVTVADWRTDAHVACLRVQDAFNQRGYARDLRKLRKRVPGLAREVHAGADEIRKVERPPDDADAQRFVATLRPVENSVDDLVTASRTMQTGRLMPATHRLERKLAAFANAARRNGLECLYGNGPSEAVSNIRAPIAAERLAAIERRVLARLREADDVPPPTGPSDAIDALEEEDAALRALAVPDWARRERAAFRRGCRDYRMGLARVNARDNSGQGTTHEQWLADVKRPAKKCDRLMARLWTAMRADPVHKVE
jgi:hypothetical protein